MGRNKLFITAVVIVLSVSVMASAATRTTTIYVDGMTCGGCAISIEQVLKNTEGVEDVRVNFERGEAVVKYDDRKVTATKLRAFVRSIGFRASSKPSKKARGVKAKDSVCCNAESCETQPPG
ncbi:MAG TPA: heavy metal-associated domain-containing protein [Pyrinomonadaceae bacterium]|nr:heavy metal-associated domain-containing protein [Pyrinomonadaceae bacterium]